MRAKVKASKKRASHTTRRRRVQPKPAILSVAPLALQAGEDKGVVIPAVVKGTGDTSRGIIEVEVKQGNKVRRRAAVIPLALKKGPDSVSQSRKTERNRERVQWTDPITNSVLYGTRVAETLIGLTHQVGTGVIDTLEGLSRAFFARAARAAVAVDRTELAIEDLPFPSTRPVSQIELRAA